MQAPHPDALSSTEHSAVEDNVMIASHQCRSAHYDLTIYTRYDTSCYSTAADLQAAGAASSDDPQYIYIYIYIYIYSLSVDIIIIQTIYNKTCSQTNI